MLPAPRDMTWQMRCIIVLRWRDLCVAVRCFLLRNEWSLCHTFIVTATVYTLLHRRGLFREWSNSVSWIILDTIWWMQWISSENRLLASSISWQFQSGHLYSPNPFTYSKTGVCTSSFTMWERWQQACAISHWRGYFDVTIPLTLSYRAFSIVCQSPLWKLCACCLLSCITNMIICDQLSAFGVFNWFPFFF